MIRSRLHRTALVAAGGILVVVAALTLGRDLEPAAPVETERQAGEPDDLSAALGRCAALDGTRIEEAGCMAVWEENRRRFFGGQARPHAPVAAPVIPADPPAPLDRSSMPHPGLGGIPATSASQSSITPGGDAR